jgi:hypothetical protein
MTALISYLQGSKTYMLAATAAVYVIGAKLELWPIDPEILILIATGLAATIRAGIKTSSQSHNSAP